FVRTFWTLRRSKISYARFAPRAVRRCWPRLAGGSRTRRAGEDGARMPQRAARRLSAPAAAGALALLAAGSLLLRTGGLHAGYWIDEAIAVGIASHPLADIPRALAQDGSPPLYYVLLHGWMA